MFKITLYTKELNRMIDLPGDTNLGLLEACERADIYKKRRPDAIFTVVNMENGDFEYQV